MARRDIVKDRSSERQEGFKLFKMRTYYIGDNGTLTGAALDEGDPLPDDATYEIISSKVITLKKSSTQGYQGRGAEVVAMAEVIDTAATGSGKWSELKGTRVKIDTDPQVVQYRITFTGLTTSTVPANGSKYSAFTGTGSLTSTNLDREPVAVTVSQKVKATTLKSHVTVVFQAHHARGSTGSGAFTEINPKQLVQTGRNSHKGKRRFSCTIAGAMALKNSLYNSVFPNFSGKYAPKCNRVEIQDNWEPGRSLVIADYETPRVIGEGKLRIEVSNTRIPLKEYKVGKITKKIGTDSYKAGTVTKFGERRVVAGDFATLTPMSTIIVETAATAFYLNTFLNKVGHVNKYTLPNFGNAQPGTLLFLGPPHTTYELSGTLWNVNLAFMYSGDPAKFDKWNEMVKAQMGTWVAREMDTVDETGTKKVGVKKYYQEWVPRLINAAGNLEGVDSKIDTVSRYPVADFRDIGKNLVITGIK